jgi:protein-tyrosine phosphatase
VVQSAAGGIALSNPTFSICDSAAKNADQAVRLVGVLSEQSPKLLVHCRAGRSRSVVVLAGYLMRERRWSCDKAIAFIAGRHDIQLTPGIEGLLRSV